jgi:uncharacterized protein YndB with AHSA1/START domain
MRTLKRLLFGLAALLALLLAAGLFLPRSAHVERSIVTSAPPERVFALVDGFARFNEWSPWAELDPATVYTYSGPASGVGTRMEWSSENPSVGSGSQEVIALEPGRSVTNKLDFGPQGLATARIEVVPEGSGSRVTWSLDSSFEDDYLGRYFGLFFDRLIGPDYEKGLAKLKALAEAAA